MQQNFEAAWANQAQAQQAAMAQQREADMWAREMAARQQAQQAMPMPPGAGGGGMEVGELQSWRQPCPF